MQAAGQKQRVGRIRRIPTQGSRAFRSEVHGARTPMANQKQEQNEGGAGRREVFTKWRERAKGPKGEKWLGDTSIIIMGTAAAGTATTQRRHTRS